MKLLSQALSIILYSLISFHVYFFNILEKTDILTIIKSIGLIYNSLIQSLYTIQLKLNLNF
jgi:hypothetical protein